MKYFFLHRLPKQRSV